MMAKRKLVPLRLDPFFHDGRAILHSVQDSYDEIRKTKMYELNITYTYTTHRIGLMELSTEKDGG